MAISTVPILNTYANVTVPGTSVGPAVAVPDNCDVIVLRNTDNTDTVYFAIGTPGQAIVPPGAAPAAGQVQGGAIPPNTALVLEIGVRSVRGIIDQGQIAGSGLIFDSAAGAAICGITYKNRLGSDSI